jgi:hypothetical protein
VPAESPYKNRLEGKTMVKRHLMTMCVAVLAVSAALAQEKKTVAPPPKPADEGPSLEATMKFIQDKINGQGDVTRFSTFNGGGDTFINQTAVSADPAACRLRGSQRFFIAGETQTRELTFEFSFQDVKEITVEDEAAWRNSRDHENTTNSPPVFVLILSSELAAFTTGPEPIVNTKSPVSAAPKKKGHGPDKKVRELTFFFIDEDLANRVAKAMLHGVELCGGGGGKPEPF